MDKLKFGLFSIVVLSLVGLAWYWSVKTIESGPQHATKQEIQQLTKENEDLKEQVKDLSLELAVLKPKVPESVNVVAPVDEKPATPTVYKNQTLINELQKLSDDNIHLKPKSTGLKVGTVQKFLNVYNDTTNKVDNDYGASTVGLVTDFQKAEGLTADGESGPTTFKKMIAWLKKQG